MIRLQNLTNSVTLFLTQKSFLGCQLRCHVTQKPRNSSVLYNKTKNNPFEPKIRRKKCLVALILHESRNTGMLFESCAVINDKKKGAFD